MRIKKRVDNSLSEEEEKIGPQTEFSDSLHSMKYRLEGETFKEFSVRFASTLSDSSEHYHQLLDMVKYQRFLPAGRVQSAVGSPHNITAFNCFCGPIIKDSFGNVAAEDGLILPSENGIMDVLKKAALTLRMGGGCGWDFSTIRPAGDPIKGLGGSPASGPVSMMGMWDAMCRTVMSKGLRRGAMMGVLRVDHPDIMQFIQAKRDQHTLKNFNVSVGITDEFMRALEAGEKYELRFEGKVYGHLSASMVWDEIMLNTWDWAEPGVLFLDTINKMNPLNYCETIVSTNPCVTGDTPILTKTGYARIDELVGSRVEVWNGEEWSSVEPRVTGIDQKILKIKFSNGATLRTTPYHKFFLKGGAKVEAKDLSAGVKLQKWKTPIIEGGKDDENAYAQGFFAGDGSYHVGDDRQEYWLYGPKKDLERFLPYKSRCELPERDCAVLGSSIRLQSKSFVPGADWSIKSRLDFLAGLIDSDGTASYSKNKSGEIFSYQVQISSVNYEFLEDVRRMLDTLGAVTKVVLMKPKETKEMPDGKGGMKLYVCQTSFRILIPYSQFQPLFALGFENHRVYLPDLGAPTRDGTQYVKVVSMEEDGVAEKVYCFEEKKRNSAVFNGVLTGQCAEQPLPPSGACLLGSFNLTKYQKSRGENLQEFDFDLFKEDIRAAVRAIDNVIDETNYPLPEQEKEAKSKRRMGLGITGAANSIELLGHSYGSEEYLQVQDKILEVLRDTAYRASIELAKEKGPFPLFEAEGWLSSGFAQTLPEDIREEIREHGLRNGLLLSIAPTGTISLCADNVSSGIEPPYMLTGRRMVIMPTGETEVEYRDWAYQFKDHKCKTADQASVSEHVNVLVRAQKWIDSAVSKTCNVGSDVSFEEFKDIYLQAYKGGAKGCTTFRIDGKRFGIMVSDTPEEDVDYGEGAACYFDPETGEKSCS